MKIMTSLRGTKWTGRNLFRLKAEDHDTGRKSISTSIFSTQYPKWKPELNSKLTKKLLFTLALSICYVVTFDRISNSFDTVISWVYSDPDEYHYQRARRHAQTTEFTGEPSHIRMCRHLQPRFEHALAVAEAQNRAEVLGLVGLNLANIPELRMPDPIEMEYLIVEEDREVCRSESAPTDSLLQIFGSSLLSAAAKRFKLNVEYKHNCPQWRNEDREKGEGEAERVEDPVTIQEMLPGDLLNNEYTDKIPMEVLAIKNICMGCIAEIEANNGTLSKRNCVLFTRPTVYNPFLISGKKKVHKRMSRGKYSLASTSTTSTTSSTSATSSLRSDVADEPKVSAPIFFNEAGVAGASLSTVQSVSAPLTFGTPDTPQEFGEEIDSGEEFLDEAEEEIGYVRRLHGEAGPQLPTGIVAILPVMRDNLQKVAEVWQKGRTTFIENEIKERLSNRPGVLVGPSMKDSENGARPLSIASLGEEGAYSKVTADDAVIYLTCKKENCADELFGDALSMPFYVYATEIPRSVATITVVTSHDCVTHVDGCVSHGQALVGFLSKFYPRAKVTYLEEPCTYAAFSRMILADYLLCPPGVGCMLPALSSKGRSTVVDNPNLVFWLPQLTIANIWNLKLLPKNEVPVMDVTQLDYDSFLTKIPPGKIGQCRRLRGRLGHWTQRLDMAPSFQYPSPIRHYVGEADMRFQPTEETPFRSPSTFSWEENIFPTCETQLIDLEGLCYALAEIDIDRIFIIGDSFGMNQAQSLWKLLGNGDNPNELGVRDPNWDRIIDCPNEDRLITISYARNDQLIENDKPVDIDQDLRNCYAYCYPWTQRYLEFEGTTMMVVNTGAHYQTHHQFQYAIREFVKKVDSLNRVWDIMLFRTATPGHRDCESKPTTPFESYDEYAPTVTDEYSWDKFIGYNDYAVKYFEDREREDERGYNSDANNASPVSPADPNVGLFLPTPKRMKMEVLDVYPMTILRRDGHVSGEVCEGCQSSSVRDCMHYFLPGPPDWWNHLMYSHILDLGRRG